MTNAELIAAGRDGCRYHVSLKPDATMLSFVGSSEPRISEAIDAARKEQP